MNETPPAIGASRYPRVVPAGDAGWMVEFGTAIDPAIHDRVLAFTSAVERRASAGVIEVVPAYCAATVYFDPTLVDGARLAEELLALAASSNSAPSRRSRTIKVPVVYGGVAGPDLAELADWARLSVEEAIALHASVEYRVYLLGFSPGFPYMGTVPEAIAMPRKASPRTLVPAGSVGIAGPQTGIYPSESPGGWRLIGRTPLVLYDPARPQPFLLAPGDRVRFVRIDRRDDETLSRRRAVRHK